MRIVHEISFVSYKAALSVLFEMFSAVTITCRKHAYECDYETCLLPLMDVCARSSEEEIISRISLPLGMRYIPLVNVI